jgi:hypothetical protein
MKKSILLLCVITLFSCKKDGSEEDSLPFDMFGSWQWVSTFSGWGGASKVDSTKQYILTVLPDKKYIWCKNGDCSLGTWSVGSEKTIFSTDPRPVINFSDLNTTLNDFPLKTISLGLVFNVTNDTLSFGQNCYDCGGCAFKRKK